MTHTRCAFCGALIYVHSEDYHEIEGQSACNDCNAEHERKEKMKKQLKEAE